MLKKTRADVTYINGLHYFTRMTPYIMPGRTRSAIYFEQEFDITETLPFVENWNKQYSDSYGKLTFFQVFLCAMAGTFDLLTGQERPEIIAGVPTLYEALLTDNNIQKAGMSNIRGVFAGRDKVPHSIKIRFHKLLKENGAKVLFREGYRLTESVTVCAVMLGYIVSLKRRQRF